MIRCLLLALGLALATPCQDLSALPDWAVAPARAAAAAVPPAEADAWVLLQRWEIVYKGDNQLRIRQYRLVKVITEGGLAQAAYQLVLPAGKGCKVKRLKGWNLRPDGQVTKLDADLTVTADNGWLKGTRAVLGRPMKGSLLAFEVDTVENLPLGPVLAMDLLEKDTPIRAWELACRVQPPARVSLAFRHLLPWLAEVPLAPEGTLKLADLPPGPGAEPGGPPLFDVSPMIVATIMDPELPGLPLGGSWDALARWEYQQFEQRCLPSRVVNAAALTPLDQLRAIHGWISREVVYRQVYLSPDRGFVPEAGPEVVRRRYGDCKDQASLFLSEAKGLGFQGFPVLARIFYGRIEAEAPPSPSMFNHAICALLLERSLGLAAEVDSPRGRLLLVDPTDRSTPLGLLPAAHRGRRVMVCTDQGAIWLTIPPGATRKPELHLALDGSVDPAGVLVGTLRLQEVANAEGLRRMAREEGDARLLDHLRAHVLFLPATAVLELTGHADPMDLEHDFWVGLRLRNLQVFSRVGGEACLAPVGLPRPRPALPRDSHPRRLPMEEAGGQCFEYQARLAVPWNLAPLVKARTETNGFRTFRFVAKGQASGGGGTLLELHLTQETLPVHFGYDALDKGILAWHMDREAVLSLREDAMAFTVHP